MMSKHRCFILGAGFSKCCGLPLASELTPLVWRARARDDPTDNSPQPKLVEPRDFGVEWVKAQHDTIKLLFPAFDCDPNREDTWPDFEQLVTALDEASQYQRSFEQITQTEVQNVAADAKSALMHYLQERLSDLTDAAARSGLDTIRRFIQLMDLERDSVISFNWDVLLEIAADELGSAVCYRNGRGPGLRVAKPHGSLNLVDAPKEKYDAHKTSNNVFGLDEELEYEAEETHVVLRAKDPRQAWIRQAWAPREFVVLVEPNIRKRYDRYWIELQWVRALQMVRSTDEIVVIGFSLPAADWRPRILLQLARLNRQPPPKLILVDPNAKSLAEHYRRLTGFDPEPCTETLEAWLSNRAAWKDGERPRPPTGPPVPSASRNDSWRGWLPRVIRTLIRKS